MASLRQLELDGIKILRQSSMIETEPWGVKDQPGFINLVVEAHTGLDPEALLAVLKNIEGRLGREKTARWGPRLIDLDILLYNSLCMDTPELTIPHRELPNRDFVLKPLFELVPELSHPVTGRSVRDMYEHLISFL